MLWEYKARAAPGARVSFREAFKAHGNLNIAGGLLFLAELLLGPPPYVVLAGALLIVIAMAWLGLAVWKSRVTQG